MTFSIIMPVFNAGKYLQPAIESVLSQSFRDFELLLIDDGSTDGSSKTCDTYETKDARVIVVHQKNGGICRARNVALAIARGDYVMFCDHDDVYLPDYLATVAKRITASSQPPDVVKVNIELADRTPDGQEAVNHIGDNIGEFSWHWPSSYQQFERLTLAVWDGAYRRDFLISNSITFNEKYRFGAEDFDFMIKVLRHADTVHRLTTRCYRHYNNIGFSTSSKYHPERLDDILSVASFENATFPSADWKLRLARYRRWNGVLLLCGMKLPSCPRALSFRIPYAIEMWKRLQPPTPSFSEFRHLTRDEKVFAILQRCHLMKLYILVKTRLLRD